MDVRVLYIKQIRKDNNDTQNDLSRKLGKNVSYISEIESGKRNIKDYLFKEITNLYKTEYIDDDIIEDEIKKLIEDYVISIIKKNNNLTDEICNYYKDKVQEYKHSKGFIYTFMMDYFILENVDDKTLKEYKENCLKYMPYYESKFWFFYSIMLSFKYDIYEYENEIDDILNYCLNEKSTYGLDNASKGMFCYQLGRLYDIQRKHFESYDMCMKSIELFNKAGIEERSLEAKIQIVGLYLNLKMHDQCEKEYIKIFKKCIDKNYKYCASVCANNLAYLYILTKEYDKADYYINKSHDLDSKFSHINYFKGYICYKMETKELARKHIKELINQEIENLYNMICDYLKDNNHEKYCKYLEESIKYR